MPNVVTFVAFHTRRIDESGKRADYSDYSSLVQVSTKTKWTYDGLPGQKGVVEEKPTIRSERRSTYFDGSAVIRQLAVLLAIGKR